jgi:hypothetical protein
MKKVFVVLLSLVMVLSLAGCGVKEKIESKVSDAIGEKVIEDLSGGNVDVSGDTVKIKGDDGTEVTFGSTKWPDSDLVKNIPEFKDGTIVSVMDSEEFSMIIIEKVKEKDFTSYYESIKKDFTKDSFEMSANDVISYGGSNEKGYSIQISYERGKETLSISASKIQK